MIKGNFT